MRTFIIPDLHNRVASAHAVLSSEAHDRVVFLGDYFDSAGDSPFEARQTAQWVKEKLADPKNILLLGNHDIQYAFPEYASLRVPGYTAAKSKAINEILTPSDWAKFRLCHFEQGFLLSHAGICLDYFGNPAGPVTLDWVADRCELALRRAALGQFDDALREGGGAHKGGITWLYWNDFRPIPGWNQIVGHSYYPEVRGKKIESGGKLISENYCIDCESRWVGLLEHGKFCALDAGKLAGSATSEVLIGA